MAKGKVREYVGARYVPVFADPVTWDDERAYDPLTMVQYSGETYMSKQYVPIGAPLPTVAQGQESNEFWVHMSNWNAQVEAYREEVMRYAEEVLLFDGRIDTLEDDLPISEFDSTNTVKAAIDAINDAIEALDTSTDNRLDAIEANGWVTESRIANNAVTSGKIANGAVATEDIADHAVTDAKLAEKYFVIFGDSWSDFDGGFQNWYNAAKIGDVLQCTLKNFAVGGAGFTGGSSLISAQVTTAASNMTETEKANTKYVVIEGGVNDTASNFDYDTWLAAVRSVCTAAASQFPNAAIYIAPNLCALSYNAARAKQCVFNGMKLRDDLKWSPARQVCVVPGLPYFFFRHACSEVFRSDDLHLNGVGANAFGGAIINAIVGSYQPEKASVGLTGSLRLFLDSEGNSYFRGATANDATIKTGLTINVSSAWVSDCLNLFETVNGVTYPFAVGINGASQNQVAFANWLNSTSSVYIKCASDVTDAKFFF